MPGVPGRYVAGWPRRGVETERMAAAMVFCTRCGEQLEPKARFCTCCGAETIDASWVTFLKRVSTRRGAGRAVDDDSKDNWLPL